MTTNKDCLIYMRTSSMTNSKGDSVKRQKSSIMKWVKSNGYTVRGSYWDIESGKMDTMERTEFMKMIYDSETMGIKVLVFSIFLFGEGSRPFYPMLVLNQIIKINFSNKFGESRFGQWTK